LGGREEEVVVVVVVVGRGEVVGRSSVMKMAMWFRAPPPRDSVR
jgi:hypothetical protein